MDSLYYTNTIFLYIGLYFSAAKSNYLGNFKGILGIEKVSP
jgi:hypothetical protein